MNSKHHKILLCLTTIASSAAIGVAPVWAQNATPPAEPEALPGQASTAVDPNEIIVTARKRQESLLKVPVIETAIPMAQLERLNTSDLKNIATLVPGLVVGNQLLSIGTQVSIRGIGTSSSDPGVDQSVSLNVDGLQLGSGLAYGSGMFDVGQIEVLKGPQALFFGKSSPGGVISVRTADPTDQTELIGRAGFEYEAREARAELIASGPVGETVKARLAGQYSASRGFFRNEPIVAPGLGGKAPANGHAPRGRDYMIRGTLLWNPDSSFDARLKTNFAHNRTENADAYQFVSCPDGTGAPLGIPFVGIGEDCKLDRTMRIVDLDPAAFPTVPNGGTPYLLTNQRYGSFEMNWRPESGISFTSVTGYYDLDSKSLVNAIETGSAAPPIAVTNKFHRTDFTQEVRVTSDFSTPINFTAGGFYQDGDFGNLITIMGNTALRLPPLLQKGALEIDIKTYSLFGQARWRIVPQLELSGGVRWTSETRRETAFDYVTNLAVPPGVPRIHSSNFAPEATLTYTPTDDFTVFGAYKKGYKSGSYSVATPLTPGKNNSFGDEKVEGGEVGIKSRFLDRRLTMNLAGYHYKYSGLQVGVVEPTTTAVIPIRTVNAGAAKVYGVDFDIAYRPEAVDGLNLHASVNWNHARFTTLDNAPCYGGQTIALGCTLQRNPVTGLFTAQDLSGLPLVRAPNWQVNFGFDYDFDLGRDMKLIVTNNNQYSSRYVAVLSDRADAYQRKFLKTDLSLTLEGPQRRWDVALIGKNLTNQITSSVRVPSNAAAGVILGGQTTGGTSSGIAGVDEMGAFVDRGRELWIRVTFRPFSK
jgi:iron complex outermembrane receptor protein